MTATTIPDHQEQIREIQSLAGFSFTVEISHFSVIGCWGVGIFHSGWKVFYTETLDVKATLKAFIAGYKIFYTSPNMGLLCPTCRAPEQHPRHKGKVLIRAYKVEDRSQCLVCAGYYDREYNETPSNYDQGKGWFAS